MRSPALGLHAIPFRSRFQLLDRPGITWDGLTSYETLKKLAGVSPMIFLGFFGALYLTTLQTAGLSWSMG